MTENKWSFGLTYKERLRLLDSAYILSKKRKQWL